jgi:glutaredoxin
MVRKFIGARESHPIKNSLTSVVEAAATLIPLVAIIAGIGMMRTLPPANSTPMFQSAYQAEEFFRDINIPWNPHIPIVLSRANCTDCDTLRMELQRSRIPFFEHDVATTNGASQLAEVAQKVTKEQELPMVIVGPHVVSPRVRAIRVALAKADQPQ